MIVGMNHFTVIAQDAQRTLDFYVGLLGLTVGQRPDLGFAGAWLYAGGPQAVLHVYFDRPVPTPPAARHAGSAAPPARRSTSDPCSNPSGT